MSRLSARTGVALLGLALALGAAAGNAATPEQRREAKALFTQIRKASSLFSKEKYKESSDVVREVQGRMDELAEGADDELIKLLEPTYNYLVRAHALLELEGIELEPLKKLESKPKPMPSGDAVSFVKQVAPMLVGKCGRCHVNNARGEFSMATYPMLMRGSAAGKVIFPADAGGSRIVEVIEGGDMPRGGGQVTPDELKVLKDWIAQGAKFDGGNQQANLNSFAASGGNQNDTPTIRVTQSTGQETVSFARDIAPVLASNCNGCHVNPQRARGGLNMTNFQGLLRGGDSGAVIAPGNPPGSLLLQRVKGEGGDQRMPVGRPPLSDDVIAKIEKWVAEGATFDGPDAGQNIVQVAALAKARASTHDELSAERAQLAARNWRLGMPGIQAAQAETTNFLLVGMGEATLTDYGQQAEALVPKIAAMLGAASNEPLIKGRMTLFFFNQRYDYSEFGQMVEKRELPKSWRGHWQFNIVDAYGALIPPRDDEYSVAGLISEQLAGAYVASLNGPPRWFSDGTGRVIASRLAGKDPRVVAWNNQLPSVLATMSKPNDFLEGKLPPEAASVGNYSFVKFLMKDAKRYGALLDQLRAGQAFDQAFPAVYGGSPEQLTAIWVRTAARRRR